MLSLVLLAGTMIRTYILGVRHHLKIRLLPDFQSSFIILLVLKGATSPEAAADVCIPISLRMLHGMFHMLPIIAQPYQACMFRAMLSLDFFGLFCPSELTLSPHVILHINTQLNQDSIYIRLESSKCNKTMTPQLLWICQKPYQVCLVAAVNSYLTIWPATISSPLFAHPDGHPVTRAHLSSILDKLSIFLQLLHQVIKPHSLRIGGTTDLYLRGWTPKRYKEGVGGHLTVSRNILEYNFRGQCYMVCWGFNTATGIPGTLCRTLPSPIPCNFPVHWNKDI